MRPSHQLWSFERKIVTTVIGNAALENVQTDFVFYARELALTIACISYGNSVLVSVLCLVSVTSWYHSKPRWDSVFWFLPYDSLASLVFCDKISCNWVKRVSTNDGEKKGHPPPFKKRYSAISGSPNVKRNLS